MGILDDLAMGFGLKERTEDYDARTARNIALDQAYGDDDASKMRARRNYSTTSNPFGGTSPFNYGDFYRTALNAPQGNAQSFLRRQGGEGYSPSIMQDNRPFFQRALFSQQGTPSPTRYGIGPVKLDGPLRIPGILGMITGGLFGQQDREIPTVSAGGGAMRVRPSGYQQYDIPNTLTDDDMGLPGVGVNKYPDVDATPPGFGVNEYTGIGATPPGYGGVLGPEPESLIPTSLDEKGLPELVVPGVDDPTYEEFMVHQKELEAKMGFDPVSESQYRTMYNRMLSK